MNRKCLLMCGLLAGFPLVVLADGLDLKKELDGLKVEVELIGAGSDGGSSGSAVSSGPQALKVSNQDQVSVSCELFPDPSESQDSASPKASIEPGKYATLRVPGKYTGAPLGATLRCKPE